MLWLLAATAQVDDATLRQRETNPEHQESELREALRGAVGTDSRDGGDRGRGARRREAALEGERGGRVELNNT